MKRSKIFNIFLLAIFFIQFISAGGVGISPAHYKEFFEPNLEKSFRFYSFNLDEEKGVNLYVKGDLAEYVELSETYLQGGGTVTATVSLPEKIERPGTHIIYIGAIEGTKDVDSTLGGIAAVQGRIDIIVPYPGKYTESTFEISNINEGEDAAYSIEVNNLGTESVRIRSKIEIFKSNTKELLLTKNIPEETPKTKEVFTSSGYLDTRDFSPGDYDAFATIDWEEGETIHNKTLRVGEFLVDIIDYDYQFEQGKINPFNIKIQNKWNSKIEEVSASVSITDNGVVVGDFKTVSVDTNPWEIKNITGHFDTSNLETKRYIAKIDLSYEEETTSKLVAIYINPPVTETYATYIMMAIAIVLLVIIMFIYLIWKIKKLEHKNENKK